MTNAPKTRKTHVVRLAGTNRNGDVLQDISVDVERIDIAKSTSQAKGTQWQGVQRKLLWKDDPQAEDYEPDGNPARKQEIIKVCDPENTTDVNDPDEWVPVPIIRSMKSKNSDVGTQDRQRNNGPDDKGDDLNIARVVEARRIFHYDTNIDDAAQAAFDADPTLKAFVVPGDDYTREDSSKDDTQYVEHEIITFYKAAGNNDDVSGQDSQVKLLNQYLIDESVPATLAITGDNGVNPPYRLDPFQNIVNVNWGRDVIVAFIDDISSMVSTFTPVPDKSKLLLSSFVLPLSGGMASFYKVSANIGEFMHTSAPPQGGDFFGIVGHRFYAVAFAISGSIDDSLAKAKIGADLVLLAIDQEYNGIQNGAKADPPGLIWSVGLNHLPPGFPLRWKAGYVKHRNDNDPLNKMAQIYPLSPPWTINVPGAGSSTYSGYTMRVYRLDRKGTGQSYGTTDPDSSSVGNSIDPIWHQPISTAGIDDNPNFGIPFGDPPPLINVDVPNAGDHV